MAILNITNCLMTVVFDDQIKIDDLVEVDQAVGVVEHITLGALKLRSIDGTVHFVKQFGYLRFCDACRIFKTTVSFGSVNSLCEMPCTMSHASIPAEKRTLPADLVRLSIGIEDVRDLITDLTQAREQ